MSNGRGRRRAARVVVFDSSDRLLLINARDPVRRDGADWWEIPGGGIDPGETSLDAVRRELWEEAGIRDAEIGPCVWTQTVEFTFGGWHFEQDEWVHVAHCDGATAGPRALEALEALAFGEQRWWNVDELLERSPRTIPYPKLRSTSRRPRSTSPCGVRQDPPHPGELTLHPRRFIRSG